MVLSISGPSSTYKTTLLNRLREDLPQLHYIDELYRRVVNKKVDLDDPEKAFLFQLELTKAQISLPKFNKNIIYIMDRCSYDYLVYTMLHFQRLSQELQKKYSLQWIEAVAYNKKLLKPIDCIFLAPVTNDIVDDGIRPDIYKKLRKREIELFSTLIRSLDKTFCILPTDFDDRIFTIKSYIERNKHVNT